MQYVFGISMFLIALFLILVILVQRGRGGGLAGALGGMGGQSAFGAKAGDTFTRVTMVAATLWILLCMGAIKFLGQEKSPFDAAGRNRPVPGALPPDASLPAAETTGEGSGSGADETPSESP